MNLQEQGTQEKITKLNNVKVGDIFLYTMEDGITQRLFMRIAIDHIKSPSAWQNIDCVELESGVVRGIDLNATVTEVEHILRWSKK